jgi:hypothetical protein
MGRELIDNRMRRGHKQFMYHEYNFFVSIYVTMYDKYDVCNMNKYRALVRSVHLHVHRKTATQTVMKSDTYQWCTEEVVRGGVCWFNKFS